MKLSEKRGLLTYLESHNDGSETAQSLIRLMKNEVHYADCNSHSVCGDDLDSLPDSMQKKLREHFGKAESEDWTAEECEEVAERLADFICEDYGDDLYNTIEYEF